MTAENEANVCIPEERGHLVLERLQSTLNRAYRNVAFHRQRLETQRIDPADIQSLDDVARLPFLTRKHLSENYPYDLFAVPLRDIVRIHTAPGTASNPTVSGYTRQDIAIWEGMVATALENAGVGPEDILQISLDPGLANWGRDYKSGAEAIGASVIPNTLLSIEKQLMVMRDYRPTVLVTTPSYARQVAMKIERDTLPLDDFRLKTLILTGEPADRDLRRFLEQALKVQCWQHYGLSEVPGPALAYECENHSCLHVNDEHFLPEIIDPETGQPLPPGETGELVLTTLTTRAYPLIRFRTGDRARMVTAPCSCDCRLARIEWLTARTDRLVCIRGVKVHQQQVMTAVENALGFQPQDSCLFESRYEDKTYLEIWIAVEDAFFSDEIKMLELRMKTIRDRIQESTGVPVIVRLKERATVAAGPPAA